ncbi:bifunctional tetrahydrofolate synthase/dihydrofolate synthase [Caviibacterium pharyngocola]|uniref:Dihydrofolate synthase/folylpolyglutamate synthase n=1 Tax=Caviibacterium pharyngocola TaxID=28159 RepID=A0A2M8RYZ3_9PAST|nr:bifunctional tetrahydrofolate synthase/dihydrofolate synthase [Caviibacterium pharyngocola]PJG84084.1 bifunctional tetrahydrofolate synthase/dihydrofolate synthase [Caviibacterium pharyngocola]
MNNSSTQLQATSSLEEWLSYLENGHFKAIDLGLDRIKAVAQELDLLHPASFIITVGGTNGKGTTCKLLETLLINAGYRVGVYSSPHLIRYNERVRIQNQELDDELHCHAFDFIERRKTQSLTYFEYSTLAALYLFKQAQLDVVILEVGLGGRLDATNIVDNHMAIITGIDIDHTEFLGSTREAIGFEKAGIFREGRPVIIGDPTAPVSMLEHAKKLHCRVFCRDKDWQFSAQKDSWSWFNYEKVRWKSLPIPQIPLANAATALAAVACLPFPISDEIIVQSLTEAELTGRFQRIKTEKLTRLAARCHKSVEELPQIIIDVGHNPQAARYLAEKITALRDETAGRIHAVCGILKDKDAEGVLSPLLPLIDAWHCVTLGGYRGQTGAELNAKLRQVAESCHQAVQTENQDSVRDGVLAAIAQAKKQDCILIFGSFHTVGEFLEMLSEE